MGLQEALSTRNHAATHFTPGAITKRVVVRETRTGVYRVTAEDLKEYHNATWDDVVRYLHSHYIPINSDWTSM